MCRTGGRMPDKRSGRVSGKNDDRWGKFGMLHI